MNGRIETPLSFETISLSRVYISSLFLSFSIIFYYHCMLQVLVIVGETGSGKTTQVSNSDDDDDGDDSKK